MWRREMGRRYFLLILYNFDETLDLQKYFEHFREDRRKTENNSRSGDGGGGDVSEIDGVIEDRSRGDVDKGDRGERGGGVRHNCD